MNPNDNLEMGDTLLTISTNGELDRQYDEWRDHLCQWLRDEVDGMPTEMSIDDAGPFMKALQMTGDVHEDVHLATRFLIGEASRRIRKNTEHGRVEDTLAELANRFGIGNLNTLRRCINCAETFHGNPVLFGRWLTTGDKKRWYHFIEASRADADPAAMGPAAFDQYIESELANVERTAQRVERAADELEDDDDAILELTGVVNILTTESERFRRLARAEIEDADGDDDVALEYFVDMIRNMPCMACGRPPQDNPDGHTHPHHVAPSVTAKKKSHWFRCPLCYECHTLVHTGYAKFKKQTGCDIRALVARTLHVFVVGHDARFPPGLP